MRRSSKQLLDAVLARPEVSVMTGERIADWFTAQVPASG